jgi:Xaa-Pro aminopeptidase
MTIEPGIYLEGRFGVRIENMILITEEGYENLTGSERKLITL